MPRDGNSFAPPSKNYTLIYVKLLLVSASVSELLSSLVACRSVNLDKCPGVRLIGISEVASCILGKAIFGER